MTIQASRKDLGLSAEYKIETSTGIISTDHNHLKQIMLNLLSNYSKFTLEEEIKIKAKLYKAEEDSKKRLNIEVSDTGIGISDEDQLRLFKAFEKIELGDKVILRSTGVGLDLVISNNLILILGLPERNNGMKVKSEIEKGTTFSFWIPDAASSSNILNLDSHDLSDNSGRGMCEKRVEEYDHSDNASIITVLP